MFSELYVLDIVGGRVLRVGVDDGSVTTVVADSGPAPDGVVIDPVGERLYWTTMGRPSRGPGGLDFTARNGSLRTARLDGSDVRFVLDDGSITTGKQLVAHFDDDRLYFSDREGFAVRTVGLGGGDVTDQVRNVADDSGTQECVGIAVDPAGGYLYWTQKGPSKGGLGRILRAGLSLPDGENPDSRTDIEVLWEGLPEPIDLELDVEHATIYWTDRGAAPLGNTLNRAAIPPKGAQGEQPQILADGFDEAIGLAVDRAAGVAYVTDLGGSIRAVALDGSGSDRTVLHLEGAQFTGIAGR